MPHVHRRESIAIGTAVCLGSISALHVLWGRGSTFPFRQRDDLNDHVIGRPASPSPAACNAVAFLLAVAAVSVERAGRGSSIVARIASAGCGAVLATRAGLGFSGRTDVVAPGSTSAAFRRNDRRFFAPLCTLLAAGAVAAAMGRGSVSCCTPTTLN